MSLIGILVALIIVGVLLWGINAVLGVLPVPEPFRTILWVILLPGCANFRQDVSELDLTGGVSADPNNPDSTQVTVGGKIYFRDPQARRLPNYSKDK